MSENYDKAKLRRLQLDLAAKRAQLQGLSDAYRNELAPGGHPRDVEYLAELRTRITSLQSDVTPLAQLVAACEEFARAH